MSEPNIIDSINAEFQKPGSPWRDLLVAIKRDPVVRRLFGQYQAKTGCHQSIDPDEIAIPPAKPKP
jgi:hypothetical protein